MASKDSLTIAIPTYNRAEKAGKLAQSVLKQLGPDDELLVVDDGSSDNTSELIGAMPGVHVHRHNPNQGMVKTWNACLQLASNDWICIIHDDDLLCDGAVKAIRLACAVAGEPALITHAPLIQDETNPFVYKVFPPGQSAVFCSATGTIPSGAVLHRKIIQDVGYFDEELAYSADVEYFARISKQYKLFVIESPAIVAYQIHDDNYQYKTWLKPDFFPQLLEIERRIMIYAGLTGVEEKAYFNKRVLDHLIYINQRSKQFNNKLLMREYGLRLWQASGCRRRTRLSGLITALRSWLPI